MIVVNNERLRLDIGSFMFASLSEIMYKVGTNKKKLKKICCESYFHQRKKWYHLTWLQRHFVKGRISHYINCRF